MESVRARALVGLIIGATLFGWSDVDAVLCVKSKKGVVAKVTIRETACKGKESVGDPTTLLGFSTTTTTLPPARRASRIVDSAGNMVSWVTISPVPGPVQGVWALQTRDDGAIEFPMTSSGPAVLAEGGVDDFSYGFYHQGSDCAGDRYTSIGVDLFNLLLGSDLVKIVYPSADGKTGYLPTSELTTVDLGYVSEDSLIFQCAKPSDPEFPPTVTCDTSVPVGSAFPCDPSKLGAGDDPATQCTCIRCCTAALAVPGDPNNPPFNLYRVQTVDLGLGNSTPPFRIEP